MKKLKIIQLFTRLNLLRFLVFVFGILFGGVVSFCSADGITGIYHNSDLGLISFVVNGETRYTLKDKNEGATCTNVDESCSNGTRYLFSEISCPDGYFLPDVNYFSGFYNLVFNIYGITYYRDKGVFLVNNFFLSPCAGDIYGYYWYNQAYKGYTVYKAYGGSFSSDVGWSSTTKNNVRCFKSSIVEPAKDTWSVITGDDLPDLIPKFKINYGNTSYEYELNDNLFIHLKSPTIQNGNTFTYAGSTGINLFYNGTSQFYNKSNLYLESMYWYNNNIFTPICL